MKDRMLSAVVLTLNEEVNLPACLESLGPLNCAVFVVDSGSTDRTVEIAGSYGATVVSHAFENYGTQRNWALDHLPLEEGWVLNLDADEHLTSELCREILAATGNAPRELCGFLLRRRTVFLGRWIRHGGHYPSYQLRLFRHGAGRCEDRLYDQHYVVNGRVEKLRHDYIDVVAADLVSWSQRHVRWARAEANEIGRRGAKGARVEPALTGTPLEQRRWMRESFYQRWPLLFRAALYWAYRYFLRFGVLDGKEGLIFHFLQGFWFRFLVDSLISEAKSRAAESR